MKTLSSTLGAVALSAALAGSMQDAGAGVSQAVLDAGAADNWVHTNGNYAGQRYSTLTQINTANAKNLKIAWIYSLGGRNDAMATPSYYDGLIYVPQDNKVYAIDAQTGKGVWKYEYKLPDDWGGLFADFMAGKHRGVALHGDYVYFLSNDAKLHAIHMKTGKAKWVKSFEGFQAPRDFAKAKDSTGYLCTVGPMAIPGTIIVPMNGTDFGGRPGYVLGVDPETGNLKWKANMIPGPGEVGYDTWPEGSQEYGGAGPWIVGSYDPQLKMYFTGTANAYEWNPKHRGGGKMDNLGAASIVAVNTETGKVAWRFGAVPGDYLDFDVPQTPILIQMNGKTVVAQPNKTGFIHYLDAQTGKFIKADKFADKVNWTTGMDSNGRPMNVIPLPEEGGAKVEVWPGLLGTVNMYPNAYNPTTGLFYLSASDYGMMYGIEPIKVVSNVRHLGASWENINGPEVDQAWNPATGKEAWRIQRDKPGYAGGMLTTAGNLTIFTTQGGLFQVADATTGKVLYSMELGTAAKAGPSTFMVNGKQMIVQAVGGLPGFGRDEQYPGLNFGSMVVAFELQ